MKFEKKASQNIVLQKQKHIKTPIIQLIKQKKENTLRKNK